MPVKKIFSTQNCTKQLMNKYTLARINKNCKTLEGQRRLEKGNQMKKHQMKRKDIKHSGKGEVSTITASKDYTSTGSTATKQTKQPQTTGNIYLQKQSIIHT